ncbi:MAG: polyhydroxyalkanoate depolymerase, partial [Cupriavidus necator]
RPERYPYPSHPGGRTGGAPLAWFEQHLIDVVPLRFAGAGRRVYPGSLQVAAFLSMNPARHAGSLMNCYQYLVQDDTAKGETIRTFYEDYFATMDVPAEFYLDTLSKVFQQHALPLGQLVVHGRRVDPRATRRTALLTVEGELDDICAVGQTAAAHELCSGLPLHLKSHYVQTGVWHYGAFTGRRWSTQIYPFVRDVIYGSERHGEAADMPRAQFDASRPHRWRGARSSDT